VILKVYDIEEIQDPLFNMPVLTPSHCDVVLAKSVVCQTLTLVYLNRFIQGFPQDVLFEFNAQHDCHTAKCKLSSSTGKFVEQE
jgi:hypothetical protein